MPSVLWRLQAARIAFFEGRYEEALQGFVWFFERAMDYQPSVRAVRLSSNLAEWAELAKVYPKARAKLEEIRDQKAAALRLGSADSDVFHDVASINEYLGCEKATYTLFAQLAWANPELAEQCAIYARPSVIHAGDFKLAERFLPDPMDDLWIWGRYLNKALERRKRAAYENVPGIESEIDIYAGKIKEILAVLNGCERRADAAKFKSLAIKQIKAPHLREAVRNALEPKARPWYERGTPRG